MKITPSYIAKGQLIHFYDDVNPYVVNNLAPDHKTVFARCEKTGKIVRKHIAKIAKINMLIVRVSC